MRGVIRLLAVITTIHQGVSGFAFTSPTSTHHVRSVQRLPFNTVESSSPPSASRGSTSAINSHHGRRQRLSRRYGGKDVVERKGEESTIQNKSNDTSSSSVQSDGLGLASSVALTQAELVEVALSEQEANDSYITALKRTFVWVAAAVAFGFSLSIFDNPTTSEEFFAGYLLEQSLSIDNLLVFLLLFEYFRIPLAFQNRILNWGIIGAIFMRAIMIGAGAVAIQKFHAVLLVFASILIFSAGKVLIGGDDDEEEDFSQNMVVQFSNKLIKSTSEFDGDRFFTEVDGLRLATPMFICMVAVELSDVIFAVDSIPAVFGVTEVSIP
jgi:TerC family integral membrane protein